MSASCVSDQDSQSTVVKERTVLHVHDDDDSDDGGGGAGGGDSNINDCPTYSDWHSKREAM